MRNYHNEVNIFIVYKCIALFFLSIVIIIFYTKKPYKIEKFTHNI